MTCILRAASETNGLCEELNGLPPHGDNYIYFDVAILVDERIAKIDQRILVRKSHRVETFRVELHVALGVSKKGFLKLLAYQVGGGVGDSHFRHDDHIPA